MEPTIYAAFNNGADAEKAAGAVMDHGIKPEQISLIVSEEYHKHRSSDERELDYTHPHTVVRNHDPLYTLDPLNNSTRDTPVTIDPAYNRHDLGAGMELLDNRLNPAQDDYPRSNDAVSDELSSAPANAPRDYNAGIEKDGYNASYNRDVERENRTEWVNESGIREAPTSPSGEGVSLTGEDEPATVAPPVEHEQDASKLGISTTTIGDAASGAAKGALFGLGLGAVAAVATLAVPGFGIVLGGGALAAAIGTMAATAGAGAVAGGVVGYLKDQGVPAHDIPQYQKAIEGGGALLAIHLSDAEDRVRVEEVLRKYGANVTNSYGYAA